MTLSTLDYFASLVSQDNAIPLFEAAVTIAQELDPELDLEQPQSEIDVLAARLRQRFTDDISQIEKLRMLNHFFYNELGFSGNINDYYSPANSFLHHVIHTRRGIPISLAVIYMELAQQVGIEIQGISFPGHFLMKLTVRSGDIILDPFTGESLSSEALHERLEPYLAANHLQGETSIAEFLHSADPRDILVRMLRNLKIIFVEQQQWDRLLLTQQRLMILLPHDITERRDRGFAYANLDCPQAALADIDAYLAERPDASDAEILRSTVRELRNAARRLN